jgi:hypothetical protein
MIAGSGIIPFSQSFILVNFYAVIQFPRFFVVLNPHPSLPPGGKVIIISPLGEIRKWVFNS